MEHWLLALYLLPWAASFAALVILAMLYRRHRTPVLGMFFLATAAGAALLLLDLASSYCLVVGLRPRTPWLRPVLFAICIAALGYSLPRLAHLVANKTPTHTASALYAVAVVAVTLLMGAGEHAGVAAHEPAALAVHAYVLVVGTSDLRKRRTAELLRRPVRAFLAAISVFCALLALQIAARAASMLPATLESVHVPAVSFAALMGGLTVHYGGACLQEPQRPRTRVRNGLRALSAREREVAGVIERGLSNQEIAAALYIAPGTVKNHIYHIYRKLGVHSRMEMVRKLRK